jgi:hypothetical protein
MGIITIATCVLTTYLRWGSEPQADLIAVYTVSCRGTNELIRKHEHGDNLFANGMITQAEILEAEQPGSGGQVQCWGPGELGLVWLAMLYQ